MKKIGEGYSYEVYEIENNRVLKTFKKSHLKIFFYLFSREGINFFTPFVRILKFKKIASEYHDKILKRIPLEIIGNPIFLNNTDYEQDKMSVFGDSFVKVSTKKAQKFLDSYFELCVLLWRSGYHDMVYNFLVNCGLDKNNQCCLVDFNELADDFDFVKNDIKLKKWRNHYDYLRLSKDLKEYFETKAKIVFTEENLILNWKHYKT